jgi:hypothetical protein
MKQYTKNDFKMALENKNTTSRPMKRHTEKIIVRLLHGIKEEIISALNNYSIDHYKNTHVIQMKQEKTWIFNY